MTPPKASSSPGRPGDAPLVSIAIACYNQAAFIKEAMDSALAQDHPNIEVVVADDGSTDGTREIVSDYVRRHAGKVRSVGGDHLGVTRNCNRLIAALRGEFVAYLAGDDLCAPGRVSRMVAWLQHHRDHVGAVSATQVISETGESVRLLRWRKGTPLQPRFLLHARAIPATGSMVLRRTAYAGLAFDERLPTVSDWLLFVQLSLAGPIGYLDDPLYLYRLHPASLFSSARKDFRDERLMAVDIVLADHPELFWALRRQRSHIWAASALVSRRRGDFRAARQAGWIAVMEGKRNPFAWLALALALGGRPGKRLLARLLPTLSRRIG